MRKIIVLMSCLSILTKINFCSEPKNQQSTSQKIYNSDGMHYCKTPRVVMATALDVCCCCPCFIYEQITDDYESKNYCCNALQDCRKECCKTMQYGCCIYCVMMDSIGIIH